MAVHTGVDDLCNRELICCAISERMTVDITVSSMKMAIDGRARGEGLIFHSEWGSQYEEKAYRKMLESNIVETDIR